MYTRLSFILLFLGCSCISISAQKSSELTPDNLSFTDAGTSFTRSDLNIDRLRIVSRFDSTRIRANAISTTINGLRASIDEQGFIFRDLDLPTTSYSHLNRKKLTFATHDSGPFGLDYQTNWILGTTDVGEFDPNKPVQSALSLKYSHMINGVVTEDVPVFSVWPYGNIAFGRPPWLYSGSGQVVIDNENWSHGLDCTSSSRNGQSKIALLGQTVGYEGGDQFGLFGTARSFADDGAVSYGVYGLIHPSSNPTYAVYANGNLAFTGSFSQVSDRKFKKNIARFSALDRVMKLQPRAYEMKRAEFPQMNLAKGKQFGFIAQELREVFPELVREDINAIPRTDGGDSLSIEKIEYLGVDYISLVPVLTQAMQEQQELIVERDAKIKRLERKNRELEDRLAKLEGLVREWMESEEEPTPPHSSQMEGAQLLQNRPNPFSSGTLIPYVIPEGVREAVLQITDTQGRMIKAVEVSTRGRGETMLQMDGLSGGTYYYSLILDGRIAGVRKMILIRE